MYKDMNYYPTAIKNIKNTLRTNTAIYTPKRKSRKRGKGR